MGDKPFLGNFVEACRTGTRRATVKHCFGVICASWELRPTGLLRLL